MTDPQADKKPDNGGDTPVEDRKKRIHTEELLDEALDESFPASDPPSIPDPRKQKDRP
ncbi:MAG: hypothetical protein WCZ66_05500 [Sphingomonadaceae bacterium]